MPLFHFVKGHIDVPAGNKAVEEATATIEAPSLAEAVAKVAMEGTAPTVRSTTVVSDGIAVFMLNLKFRPGVSVCKPMGYFGSGADQASTTRRYRKSA